MIESLLEIEEMARQISKDTNINIETVLCVLEAETEYLIGVGLASITERGEQGE